MTRKPLSEAIAELDRRFPDWTTFPVYRRVAHCNMDDLLFHDESGSLATGTYSYGQNGVNLSFHAGRWLRAVRHTNLATRRALLGEGKE
jgi:hypothetical protein